MAGYNATDDIPQRLNTYIYDLMHNTHSKNNSNVLNILNSFFIFGIEQVVKYFS